MSSPEAMRKLADCVEALHDVDGVTVEQNEVTEQPSGDSHPFMAMLSGEQPEMEEVLVIVCSLDEGGPKQEKPDGRKMDPDEIEDLEDAEEIEVE